MSLVRWNTPGVCGLDNSGNSCYFNAVLQCLCSTVPLVEHLLNQDTRKDLARLDHPPPHFLLPLNVAAFWFSQWFNIYPCRSKCRVAEVFVRLLEKMWMGRSSSCAPVEARSVLCSILPQFDNYCQQDAQELLLFLLNALQDDLKKVQWHQSHLQHHSTHTSLWRIPTSIGRVNLCVCQQVSKCQMQSLTRQLRQDQRRNCATAAGESTIVSRLFESQLSYMTLCMHCDHQAHSTQTFTVLSLPIPTDRIKCSIQVAYSSHSAALKPSPALCPFLSHSSVCASSRIACRYSLSKQS